MPGTPARTTAPATRQRRQLPIAAGRGNETRDAIRRTAVRLFRTKGFEATSLRELAKEVGIEAASLYNHFPSKQGLLADILVSAMEDVVARLHAARDETADADPAVRLRRLVTEYVLFHEDRLEEAAISDSERRALEPADARRLLQLRSELSDLFRQVIVDGVAAQRFRVDDVSIATLVILSMVARLPVWYKPRGRLRLPEIADAISAMALRSLGADDGAVHGRRRRR